jgi:hypothetical protein
MKRNRSKNVFALMQKIMLFSLVSHPRENIEIRSKTKMERTENKTKNKQKL